jgi:putative sterol carrier protein
LPAQECPIAHPFPSEGWPTALAEVLKTDRRQARVARSREGDILVLTKPEPDSPPVARAAGAWLDLWHGKCRRVSFHLAGGPEMPKPAFTLRAQRSMLLRVIEGGLESMQVLVTRKLKVEGNLAYRTRSVPTVLDHVRCCRVVEIAH